MIHLPVPLGHHHGDHPVAQVPARPIAAIVVGVLLVNVALLWIAFGLRGGPPSDSAQIEDLVHRQITALNNRDASALQLTYCAGSGPIGAQIVDTLGLADGGDTVDVARITDIRFIGSSPADLATADVTLTISGSGNQALSATPEPVSYFKREQTGWKMCQPNDLQQVTRHL